MIHDLSPPGGGLEGDLQPRLHLFLPDIFLEPLWPQRVFNGVLMTSSGIEVGVSVHDSYSLTGLPLVSSRWPDNLGARSPTPLSLL